MNVTTVVEALLASRGLGDAKRLIVRSVREALEARVVWLVAVDGAKAGVSLAATCTDRELPLARASRMRQAAARLLSRCAFLDALFACNSAVARTSDLVGAEAWAGSEFRRALIRWHDIGEHLTIRPVSPRGSPTWLILAGFASGTGPSAKGLQLLKQLLPLFGRGLQQARDGERWRHASVLTKELSEVLALVHVKGRGQPCQLLTATRGAAALLGLRQSSTGPGEPLRRFISACSQAAGTPRWSVVWQAGNGHQFRLTLQPTAMGENFRAVHFAPVVSDTGERDEFALARQAGLSPREAEVFALLAAGKTNKEIARALGISYHTARTHMSIIFRKLGVSNRVSAISQVRGRGMDSRAVAPQR